MLWCSPPFSWCIELFTCPMSHNNYVAELELEPGSVYSKACHRLASPGETHFSAPKHKNGGKGLDLARSGNLSHRNPPLFKHQYYLGSFFLNFLIPKHHHLWALGPQYLLFFLFFGHTATCRILVPWPGIKPMPPADVLTSDVLTSGPPGKSQDLNTFSAASEIPMCP